MRKNIFLGNIFLILSLLKLAGSQEAFLTDCEIPDELTGEFYSYENGYETFTNLYRGGEIRRKQYSREAGAGASGDSLSTLKMQSDESGRCISIVRYLKKGQHPSKFHWKMHYRPTTGTVRDCSQCIEFYNRTRSVLEIRRSSCNNNPNKNLTELCNEIADSSSFITLFNKTYEAQECRSTIYGTYQFRYEFKEAGQGQCDNPESKLISCPEPGSPFQTVNQRFTMKYGMCKSLISSIDAEPLYDCLGNWMDEKNNIYTVIANQRVATERSYDKFRCMLTRKDQPQWFTKSLYASCQQLYSPTDGPEKVIITPVVPKISEPKCFFPQNFSGEWVNTANINAKIVINHTHIYESSRVDNRGWLRETYYTCQQAGRNQYLVRSVTKGECFDYFICLDFNPRHHNVLQYRKSKSFMARIYDDSSKRDPFYEVCAWTSFGGEAEWKYSTYVLYPPAATECPFTGIYRFGQKGQNSSKIHTRIRGGYTPAPRNGGWYITCRPEFVESQFSICGDQTKIMNLDAQYCREMNPDGTPIGVYEMIDNVYQCAGHWRENSRSYLVTFERDEPFNRFRCWVYERRDLFTIFISRSIGSACGFNQTSESYLPQDGADLALELTENERIHDNCPIRYDDGRNPYLEIDEFQFYYASANQFRVNSAAIFSLAFITLILFL